VNLGASRRRDAGRELRCREVGRLEQWQCGCTGADRWFGTAAKCSSMNDRRRPGLTSSGPLTSCSTAPGRHAANPRVRGSSPWRRRTLKGLGQTTTRSRLGLDHFYCKAIHTANQLADHPSSLCAASSTAGKPRGEQRHEPSDGRTKHHDPCRVTATARAPPPSRRSQGAIRAQPGSSSVLLTAV
jgi:hypothetical protein